MHAEKNTAYDYSVQRKLKMEKERSVADQLYYPLGTSIGAKYSLLSLTMSCF